MYKLVSYGNEFFTNRDDKVRYNIPVNRLSVLVYMANGTVKDISDVRKKDQL